jgi:hypothetical protein
MELRAAATGRYVYFSNTMMKWLTPAAVAAFVLAACNRQPEPRRYVEIAFREKGAALAVQAPIRLNWSLPEGWVEQAGGDPMRTAGFLAPDPELAHTGEMDPKAVDISLVQLAGDAGGLQANVTRWLGQVKVIATPGQVKSLIEKAERISASTGQEGIIVDFTGMLSGDLTEDRSIVGVIVQGEGYTVFLKGMGDRDRLMRIKPQILAFAKSLSIAEEAP